MQYDQSITARQYNTCERTLLSNLLDTTTCTCGKPLTRLGRRAWIHADGYFACRTYGGGSEQPEPVSEHVGGGQNYQAGYNAGYHDAVTVALQVAQHHGASVDVLMGLRGMSR